MAANGSPLRIGLVTADPLQMGGVQTHAATVHRMLTAKGIDCQLLYTLEEPVPAGAAGFWLGPPRKLARNGLPGYALPRAPLPFAWSVLPALTMGRTARSFDLLLAVTGSSNLAFPLALRRLKYLLWVGTIWRDELVVQAASGNRRAERLLGSPAYRVVEWQERRALCSAATIITNSRHTARRTREFAPACGDRVETITLPVDTDHYTPSLGHASVDPRGGYLLCVGRLNDERKNVPMLLGAFARILRQFPDLTLVLAGEPPSEAMRASIDRLGLTQAVRPVGRVDGDHLRSLYQGAQLLLLSSFQEGLGQVLLEAMACGTPFVATRCGGPEELVEDDPDVGALVEIDDGEGLADKVVELLDQPRRLAAMRNACARVARERYSLESAYQKLRSIVAAGYPELEHRLPR